jgi:hypothetical protein
MHALVKVASRWVPRSSERSLQDAPRFSLHGDAIRAFDLELHFNAIIDYVDYK